MLNKTFKKTALSTAIAGGMALAAGASVAATNVSPAYNTQATPKPTMLAGAHSGKKACNPCNPCGAKKACNPCNPCAAKKACNPCNPCAAKKACNPCNPCAAKKHNPCNPCAAKKKM